MKALLFISVLIFFCFVGQSQINQYGIPFITNYTPQEYGASEQNWSIVQDHRGVMYFGNTDNGVIEYDGVHWRKIPIDNNSIVRSLAIDKDGVIYVGAQGEFGYLKPNISGRLIYQTLKNELDTSEFEFSDVWKIHTSDKGIFFCTTSKIFQYNYDTIEIINLKHGAFFSFYVNDVFYSGHYINGLEEFSDTTFKHVKGGGFFSKKGIYTINSIGENNLLIGTFPNGLYTYAISNGNVIENFANTPANEYLKNNQLYNSFKINNNHYAFSTLEDGVIIMDSVGDIVNIFSKEQGVQNETVINVYSSKRNYETPLWLALNNGIGKVEINSPIRKFNELQGLNGSVYDIIRFKDRLYIATSLGVYYLDFDDNNYPVFKKIEGIDDQTWSIVKYRLPDLNKEILLAGTITGMYAIYENGKSEYIDPFIRKKEEADLKGYITKIHVSKFDNHTIYIGKVNGLTLIENIDGNWKRKNINLDITDEIRKIEEDSVGNIWLGTYNNGIVKLQKTGNDYIITHYDEKNGLPDKRDIEISNVRNELIFGTSKGEYIFNDDSNIFILDGRFQNETAYGVFRLVQKNDSSLWISAFHNDKRWIERGILKNESIVMNQKPFKRLPNEQVDVIYHDIDGITWLGSASGIYSFNSNFEKNYNENYQTLIRKVFSFNDSALFYGTNFRNNNGKLIVDLNQPEELIPILIYAYNSLTFEFAAPFFEEEKEIEFSYLLEGYKDAWSKWNTEPKAVFTNLREGKYNFKVKAKNIYGIESETASYQFTILPPWYRTLLAYFVYAIFILIAMIVVVKLYTRKLRLEKIKLEGIVQERTAEIRCQKDAIEQKNEILKEQKEEIEAQADSLKEANIVLQEQKEEITHQKEEITSSIVYAKRIQRAIVPTEEMAETLLKNYFLLWRPRDIVSGDFWWLGEKDGLVIVAAADCTGHGVPGAFMSMLGISFLNEIINQQKETQSHEILNQLRTKVKTTLGQTGKEGEAKDGMDIALMVIDFNQMTLQFSGAYNPLYLVRNGEVEVIKADKNPIGIYIKEKETFTQNIVPVQTGDTLYIFSDGYIDQFGGPHQMKFTSNRFRDLLLTIQDKPMAEQKEILNTTIDEWRAGYEQIDDILVLGIKI